MNPFIGADSRIPNRGTEAAIVGSCRRPLRLVQASLLLALAMIDLQAVPHARLVCMCRSRADLVLASELSQ